MTMSTATIRVIRVHHSGGSEQLKLEQQLRPEPRAGEVLVRVRAAGVNPIDWKIRQGLMKDFFSITFPYTPGMDVARVVEGVGPGVTTFKIGQAVFGRGTQGAYAEYITTHASAPALKPETLSFVQAATIPVGATTAWRALFDEGHLQAGQRGLLVGAAGGVGLLAVQLAKWKDAQVIRDGMGERRGSRLPTRAGLADLEAAGAQEVILSFPDILQPGRRACSLTHSLATGIRFRVNPHSRLQQLDFPQTLQ